ncbi:HipA N-terminal domain-containing protein [Alcanivorax sp. KX64203]|uniref:HipA N-terminal domain-containing protein n=1 Tax=Alloalcanivorax xenomutans TaxID=1094342 RepID=UPI0007A76334|nr:hypothetical protein A3Q32_07090 [Alcanivorax sp. KX64203]
MRTKQAQRRDLDVHLGTERRLIGRFYLGSGKRSAFRYDERWLRGPRLFKVSPDRQPVSGVQHPQGVFFRALEDTAPDAWGGERAIRRAHAKSRQQDRELPPLAPVDFSPGLTMKPAPGHCACSILRVRPIFTLASIGLSRR